MADDKAPKDVHYIQVKGNDGGWLDATKHGSYEEAVGTAKKLGLKPASTRIVKANVTTTYARPNVSGGAVSAPKTGAKDAPKPATKQPAKKIAPKSDAKPAAKAAAKTAAKPTVKKAAPKKGK